MYIACAMRGTVGAVWSLPTRTRSEPTQSEPGRNIHDEKIQDGTSVKTNSHALQDCWHANFSLQKSNRPPPGPIRTPGSYQFVLLVQARPAHFLTALMNGEGDFESVLPRPLLAAGAKLDITLRAFQRYGRGGEGRASNVSGLIGG